MIDYYKANKGTSYFPECKKCNGERAKAWQRAARLANPDYDRKGNLRRLYNITPEQFDTLLEKQGGGCAVCGSKVSGSVKSFHVDHDHSCCPGPKSCGKCVRGVLCHHCNAALGAMRDDPDRLAAAAAYILRTRDVLGQVTY